MSLSILYTIILHYIPIEKLVQFAYNEDPEQVRENLLNILNIAEESITPTPSENIFLNGKFYICKKIK